MKTVKETAPRHTFLEGGDSLGENIDRLSANRPSVYCFTVTDRASSFIATDVTAVEAGAEESCSAQGSYPNQDLMIVNH